MCLKSVADCRKGDRKVRVGTCRICLVRMEHRCRTERAMSTNEHSFIFSSLNSKRPHSTRKAHIRRLHDILQLCIQRRDWARAKRAWAILVRCGEVDWKTMWTTSVLLLSEDDPEDNGVQANGDRVRFLSIMMRQHPDEVRFGAG